MDKAAIRDMVQAEVGPGVSAGTIDAWVESGRRMVAGAAFTDGFGRMVAHVWSGLQTYNTLTVVSGTTDYTLPDDFVTDPKREVSKIMNIEGQGAADAPVKILPVEVANEMDLSSQQAVIIIEYPAPGQIKVRLKNFDAGTYDCWYKRLTPKDSLDFVPQDFHDVFYWAALIFTYKKAQTPQEAGGFQNAVMMYKERLAAAIGQDYHATQEYPKILPSQIVLDYQNTVFDFEGDR